MKKTHIAIIGSGPAGYSAAIYNSRAQLEPTVFAGFASGGQLMNTTEVENFAGFPKGIMGPELMMGMREQAVRFGTKIEDAYVTAVDFSQRPFKLWTDFPKDFDPQQFGKLSPESAVAFVAAVQKEHQPTWEADAVIIATGAAPITLGVAGEQEFWARGVSACAVCDGAFFRDKVVFVVGGGDSAMEDATAVSRFAKEVHIVHRRDSFRASKIMQERVLNNPKITVHWNSVLEKITGTKKVEHVTLTENGVQKEYATDGVFMAIGHRPMNSIFVNQVQLDDKGYMVTRQSATTLGVAMAQQHSTAEGLVAFPTMTSVAGVFAAGDGVDVRYKQAITAAGQGCAASLDAERWLEQQAD